MMAAVPTTGVDLAQMGRAGGQVGKAPAVTPGLRVAAVRAPVLPGGMRATWHRQPPREPGG